jgi:uncharacterized membrane protein YeaQ/YmgE (transglycosylase-associated protein family)
MDLLKILVSAVVGGVAGWLAGLMVHGKGFGTVRNVIVGLIGGVIGGAIIGFINRSTGIDINLPPDWMGQIIVSLIGAVVLLLALRLLFGKGR